MPDWVPMDRSIRPMGWAFQGMQSEEGLMLNAAVRGGCPGTRMVVSRVQPCDGSTTVQSTASPAVASTTCGPTPRGVPFTVCSTVAGWSASSRMEVNVPWQARGPGVTASSNGDCRVSRMLSTAALEHPSSTVTDHHPVAVGAMVRVARGSPPSDQLMVHWPSGTRPPKGVAVMSVPAPGHRVTSSAVRLT